MWDSHGPLHTFPAFPTLLASDFGWKTSENCVFESLSRHNPNSLMLTTHVLPVILSSSPSVRTSAGPYLATDMRCGPVTELRYCSGQPGQVPDKFAVRCVRNLFSTAH